MSSLQDELLKLRRMLLSMAAEVEQRVQHAIAALLKHDLRLAEQVRDRDDEIDSFDLNIEAECIEIIALHHPVAKDLRYVLAALRINADLERIADLARGVAKRAIKLEYLQPVDRPAALLAMGNAVQAMLGDALRALAEQETEAAYRVRRSDRSVDSLYKELVAWSVSEVAVRGDNAKALMDLLSAVRSMERIGDIAANIAEAVVFSVEGTVIRHRPIEAPSSIPR